MLDSHPTLLGRHTTLRLGGEARHVLTAHSQDEIVEAVRSAAGDPDGLLVLAGGSNVVIDDGTFDGTAVLIRSAGIRIDPDPDGDERVLLTVEAGQRWDEVVELAIGEGLAGLEVLSGIPGSAGATPIQNVGAYGAEVAELLHSVRVYDRQTGETATWSPQRCGLGFRTSVFKYNDRYVILAVTFALSRSPLSTPIRYDELARALDVPTGERAPLVDVRKAVIALRTSKGMVLDDADPDTYSVGSFFKNPTISPALFGELRTRSVALTGAEPPSWPYAPELVKVSAAWLIDRAGYRKGYPGRQAGVGISGKHTLALTNRGTGTSAALLDLAREIRDGVRQKFGVELEPEAVLVGCSL